MVGVFTNEKAKKPQEYSLLIIPIIAHKDKGFFLYLHHGGGVIGVTTPKA